VTPWDYAALAILLAMVAEGVFKGALRLAFGLGGLVAGYLYAGFAADWAASRLPFLVPNLRRPVALVAGFLVIVLIFVAAGAVARSLAKKTGLGCLDRLVGAALGFLVALYLTAGAVRIATRLNPRTAVEMCRGPVVRAAVEWAFGVEEMIPLTLPPTAAPEVPAKPVPPAPPKPAAAPQPKGDPA
jgi:hypothetical protein